MAARTEKEAADNFVGFLQETLSCITPQALTAYQQSKKLYKVWFNPPAELNTRSGATLFLSITQVFGVSADPLNVRRFKAHTREYSYRLLQGARAEAREIVAYHWHPHDSELHDPHLHVARVARVHFPTSRVCVEDFIRMVLKYYGARATMRRSEWEGILEKNRRAFEALATWKAHPPSG